MCVRVYLKLGDRQRELAKFNGGDCCCAIDLQTSQIIEKKNVFDWISFTIYLNSFTYHLTDKEINFRRISGSSKINFPSAWVEEKIMNNFIDGKDLCLAFENISISSPNSNSPIISNVSGYVVNSGITASKRALIISLFYLMN